MPTLAVTQADLDAYHAATMANPRGRLLQRQAAALDHLRAAKGFIAHRYATAYHTIATERCDAAFNRDVWKCDPGRDARREAVFAHLRTIRRQIARARAAQIAA